MSPKSEFHKDASAVADHRQLVQRQDVTSGLLVAFNEYCWNLPVADNPQTSWAANAKRQGALELITTFLNLGSQEPVRQNRPTGALEDENATNPSSPTSTG